MASTKANAVTGITSTCIFYLMKRACIGFSKKTQQKINLFLEQCNYGYFYFCASMYEWLQVQKVYYNEHL
jgi:hypothetical protein